MTPCGSLARSGSSASRAESWAAVAARAPSPHTAPTGTPIGRRAADDARVCTSGTSAEPLPRRAPRSCAQSSSYASSAAPKPPSASAAATPEAIQAAAQAATAQSQGETPERAAAQAGAQKRARLAARATQAAREARVAMTAAAPRFNLETQRLIPGTPRVDVQAPFTAQPQSY